MRNALFVAMLAAAPVAQAAELKWSGVQAGLLSVDYDEIPLDGEGGGIAGSLAAGEIAYVFGSVAGYTIENTSIHVTETAFGLGAHTTFAPDTAAYGEIGFWSAEVDDGYRTFEDDGTAIGVGVRHMPNSAIELNAGFTRSSSNGDSSNSIGFGMRLYATDNVYLGAGFADGEHASVSTISLGAAF